MVAECTFNLKSDIPKKYQKYAFPYKDDLETVLDITIGRKYSVYGLMIADPDEPNLKWYLVHTDTDNIVSFWWMPESLYSVLDESHPTSWVQVAEDTISFPPLMDWKISEGLIDGDSEACEIFENAANSDPSFIKVE